MMLPTESKPDKSISVFIKQGELAAIGPNAPAREIGESGVSFRTYYINTIGVDVTVSERSGFRQKVEYEHNPYREVFIIRTEINIQSCAFNDTERFLAILDENIEGDISFIKESYYRQTRVQRFRGINITIDTVITRQDFIEKNGSMFLKSKDIVISTQPFLEAPSHPESTLVMVGDPFTEEQVYAGIGIHFDIIDNKNSIGKRYVVIAKELRVLTPRQNPNQEDGVWVTTIEVDITKPVGRKLRQIRYGYEEAEEVFGVYKTREEALSDGDTKLARKEQLARLEHENILLQTKLTREKNEFTSTISKIEHDNQVELNEQINLKNKLTSDLTQLKHETEMREQAARVEENNRQREHQKELDKAHQENKRLEMQMDRERAFMKDLYETKSYARKDSSEWLKLLPIIIGSMGAMGVVIFKLLTKAEPKG